VIVNNSTNINKRYNHILPQIIEHTKTTTYDVRNPGPDLRQAQTCDGVKLVNGINCNVWQEIKKTCTIRTFTNSIFTQENYFIGRYACGHRISEI
jgi:hypothetical protein